MYVQGATVGKIGDQAPVPFRHAKKEKKKRKGRVIKMRDQVCRPKRKRRKERRDTKQTGERWLMPRDLCCKHQQPNKQIQRSICPDYPIRNQDAGSWVKIYHDDCKTAPKSVHVKEVLVELEED